MTLSTQTFTGVIPAIPYITPPPPPAPQFTFPEPISYEFQVVEEVKENKITKVKLQVRKNTHDQYGNLKIIGIWEDVPRIQVNI